MFVGLDLMLFWYKAFLNVSDYRLSNEARKTGAGQLVIATTLLLLNTLYKADRHIGLLKTSLKSFYFFCKSKHQILENSEFCVKFV